MPDFGKIKEQVSIEEAAIMLGLEMRKTGAQFRAACPACKTGGDRALVITPEKQLFYCFSAGIGGDLITLTGHIQKCSLHEAGRHISDYFSVGNSRTSEPVHQSTVPTPSPSPDKKKAEPSFDPQKFASKLVWSEEVAALGLTEEEAQALGVGFHPQRKAVYFPIRHADNSISGFIGCDAAKLLKLPPQWLPASGNVVRLKRA